MVLSAFVPELPGHVPTPLAQGISGLAVMLVSRPAAWRVTHAEELCSLALGLWLVAAPSALGIHAVHPFWNFVCSGLVLAAHAAYLVSRPPWLRLGF